jgi:transketolase
MELPVIHIFTHDSISVGEDGPTHQPVEHLASLRALPGVIVLRPADANEVVAAWRVIMELRHGPAVLILSRQALPTFGDRYARPAVEKGGYVLADCAGTPRVILLGTGSEVSLCVEAHERLKAEGIPARVVSLPSWELFERQPQDYRDSVIPPSVTARVSVEQGEVFGWDRFVGSGGAKIGMDSFGTSAPLLEVQKKFGFTVDNVVASAKQQIESNSKS